MLLRAGFFVLMALGLMGFGTVAWVTARPAVPATAHAAEPPVAVKRMVLVTARALPVGSLLKPGDITGKEVLVSRAQQNDVVPDTPEARRQFIGSMVRRSFGAGDILRSADVMHPGDHGFLSAVLQPGMRAVTIAVDNTTGAAGLIWPGDRVDLILTQNLSQPGLPPGHRIAAETLLSDVRVLAIDQQIVQGAAPSLTDPQSRTVTLEVTQDQAERIAVAMRLGHISLAVRSASPARQPTQVAGTDTTTWASDVSPALSAQAPPTDNSVVHVFQGAQDAKEFKF